MRTDFTRKLLLWNRRTNRRRMPWKAEKDPYRIWLSEIILQQTRVEQGWTYYEKFIQEFPDIFSLAEAEERKVYKLWEGLGYYSRCRNLLETARQIAFQFKGKFPSTLDDILQLKGVGPYTAAAIASFAFNKPHAVVDGNVQRVLSRYFGINTPIDSTEGKKLFQELAQALLPVKKPAVYNQAIMDFGATVCKPQVPLCQDCVQKDDCVAYHLHLVDQLPLKSKSMLKKIRWMNYLIVRVGNRFYVRRRLQKDIWQNLYEFVLLENPRPAGADPALWPFVKEKLGKAAVIHSTSAIVKQTLSHREIRGRFVLISLPSAAGGLMGYELMTERQIRKLPFPGFINKFLSTHDSLKAVTTS